MAKRVIDLVRGRTRVEPGSAALPVGEERVAVLVQFSTTTQLSRSVVALVSELHAAGYFVVLSSACEADGDLAWPDGRMPERTAVIRKPNVGYDFGTAAVALDAFPTIAGAPYVLIVNDSNVGPFESLATVIDNFEASEGDAWSVTSSTQVDFHLQSFFLGFRGGILADRPLRAFWRGIRHYEDKRRVIEAYEVGLSRLMAREGYLLDVMFPDSAFDSAEGSNTAVNLWLELLASGYPFVKREMITKPWIEPTGMLVRPTVKYMLGEDPSAWT